MGGARKRSLTAADERAAARVRQLWKEFRERHPGISQEQAAEQAGMTQSAFSQFLLGRVPMRVRPIIKFAELFGVPPTEIRSDMPELVYAPGKKIVALEAREQLARDKETTPAQSDAEKLLVLFRTFLDTDADGREELYTQALAVRHVDESTGRSARRTSKTRRSR